MTRVKPYTPVSEESCYALYTLGLQALPRSPARRPQHTTQRGQITAAEPKSPDREADALSTNRYARPSRPRAARRSGRGPMR